MRRLILKCRAPRELTVKEHTFEVHDFEKGMVLVAAPGTQAYHVARALEGLVPGGTIILPPGTEFEVWEEDRKGENDGHDDHRR